MAEEKDTPTPAAPPAEPKKKSGKSGTSADDVVESADLTRQIGDLKKEMDTARGNNESIISEIQRKMDDLLKKQPTAAPAKSDGIWGNFWDGFFS